MRRLQCNVCVAWNVIDSTWSALPLLLVPVLLPSISRDNLVRTLASICRVEPAKPSRLASPLPVLLRCGVTLAAAHGVCVSCPVSLCGVQVKPGSAELGQPVDVHAPAAADISIAAAADSEDDRSQGANGRAAAPS